MHDPFFFIPSQQQGILYICCGKNTQFGFALLAAAHKNGGKSLRMTHMYCHAQVNTFTVLLEGERGKDPMHVNTRANPSHRVIISPKRQ